MRKTIMKMETKKSALLLNAVLAKVAVEVARTTATPTEDRAVNAKQEAAKHPAPTSVVVKVTSPTAKK